MYKCTNNFIAIWQYIYSTTYICLFIFAQLFKRVLTRLIIVFVLSPKKTSTLFHNTNMSYQKKNKISWQQILNAL